MKTNRIAISLFAAGAMLSANGCQELSIPEYDSDTHYIHFKDKSDKETRFSFAVNPGKDEYTLEIPVTLIGMALEEDTEYSVSVVREGELATTATDEVFHIEQPVFGKGLYEDVLDVKVFRTKELAEEKRITLKIENNGKFLQGPQDHIISVIYVSDIMSQPEWWNDDFETIFLGPFSDIKYEHFILATGVSDLSEMDVALVSTYTRAYIYYLRELDAKGTPLYEEDGKTKVLASIPFKA